jgi:hypothetical protein
LDDGDLPKDRARIIPYFVVGGTESLPYRRRMDGILTADMAEELLDGRDLVPAMQGTIAEMKALRDRCLAAGIPVLVGCPGGKSCGPSTHLLVTEDHLPELGTLLRADWRTALEREGTSPLAVPTEEPPEGEHLPCPACGTAAPLAEGACTDCGLQLE